MNPFDDTDQAARPVKALTREEVRALRLKSVSPWRVVAVQGGVGLVVALSAMLITGKQEMFWSALYGAAAVVIPGALLARGLTSRLSRLSPAVSAVSLMLWESVKITVTVAMLALAPRLIPGLSWPALLAALALCLLTYWFALLWRG